MKKKEDPNQLLFDFMKPQYTLYSSEIFSLFPITYTLTCTSTITTNNTFLWA